MLKSAESGRSQGKRRALLQIETDEPAVARADTATEAHPAVPPARRWPTWLARLLFLGVCTLLAATWRPAWEPAIPEFSAEIAGIVGTADRWRDRVAEAAYVLALCVTAGLSGWWAVPGRRSGWWLQPVRLALLAAIVAGLALARHFTSLGMVFVVAAAVVGAWGFVLGAALSRGLLRGLAFTIGMCLLIVCSAVWLVDSLLAVQPTVTQMPLPTASDRDRWKAMFMGARDQERSGPVELQLTRDDLNLMAASWLSARRWNTAVDCELKGDAVRTRVSIPLPLPRLGERFINLDLVSRPTMQAGHFDLQIEHVQAGSLAMPRSAATPLSRTVSESLNTDRELRRWIDALNSIEVAQDRLIIECDPTRASRAIAAAGESAAQAAPELTATVRIYLNELVARASKLPEGDERFLGLVRTAFEIARERSQPESAVLENQAALVALGIQLGDPRVRRLAGFPPDEKMPTFRYPFDRKVTLRSRNDLARHFFVSGALRAVSSQEMSFAVGLIKEQLDAADGGSGFSFVDLAADLAGVQLAQLATADASSAVGMQARLAEPFEVGDLMPEIDGLPENLTQDDFAEQFGSLTDPRFLKLTAEIQQRFAKCEILKINPTGPSVPP